MGFGPGSSDSKSQQESVTVSGSGQYNRNSPVSQGGSVLINKGAKVGSKETKISSKGNVTINDGLQPNDVKSILGELTAATPAQIQQASPVVLTPPAATPATAAAAGSINTKYVLYGLAALAVGFGARMFFKK